MTSRIATRRDFLRLTGAAAAGVGVAAVLAACGGAASAPAGASGPVAGGAKTPPQLAIYQDGDRQQVLEAGARKEGNLTWYTSLAGAIVDELANGFKEKYPFVHVDVFRAAEDQLATRATQEAQAGKQVFDVIESPPLNVLLLNESKLLAPFFSPGLAAIPEDLKNGVSGPTVLGSTIRISFIGFGYNTRVIPAAAVPKTVDDLMHPDLAGKLALAGTTTGYKWVGAALHGMGPEKGKQFLQQFAAQQKPSVQQVSGKAVLDLIARGEIPGSPTIFRDHVEQAKGQKSAVEWVGLAPVIANTGLVSFAAKAPNPNAGLLFIDYVLGEGQKVLKDDFYSLPTEKAPISYWVPENGKTPAQAETDLNSWADLFKSLFRS